MIFALIFLAVIVVIVFLLSLLINLIRRKKSRNNGVVTKERVSKLFVFVGVMLFLYTLTLLIIMIWGLYTSFKSPINYRLDKIGLPNKWNFSNYPTVIEFFYVLDRSVIPNREVYMPEMILNSVLYAFGSALLQAAVQFIMAYLASRFDFKFGKIVYALVIIGMTVPIVGSEPSALLIANKLNLRDSIFGMWIMKSYFLGMYFLIFFETLKAFPKDYAEAAHIDGASNTRVMFQIIAPLSKNTYFTIVLLLFVQFWNDYTTPMLFMPNVPTLSYGLYNFVMSGAVDEISNEPMRLAACMMLLMPVLILFIFLHDKLLSNVTIGGVKE